MRKKTRVPAWAVIGGMLNLVLWIPALLWELPVAHDPMLRDRKEPAQERHADGAVVSPELCMDCPPYALLGREVGSGVSLLAYGLAALNFPPALLASGRDIGFGIRELSPWIFFPGVLLQWAVLGALARAVWAKRARRAGEQALGADEARSVSK
jgi:hypothetical protein